MNVILINTMWIINSSNQYLDVCTACTIWELFVTTSITFILKLTKAVQNQKTIRFSIFLVSFKNGKSTRFMVVSLYSRGKTTQRILPQSFWSGHDSSYCSIWSCSSSQDAQGTIMCFPPSQSVRCTFLHGRVLYFRRSTKQMSDCNSHVAVQ